MTSFFERLEQAHDSRLGLHARNLASGEEISHRAEERFPMASTFKIPIAIALLVRVDRGEIDLQTMCPVERVSPGSGALGKSLDLPGVSLSVGNLMTMMLTLSDNTATDEVIRLLGGAASVNQTLAAIGVDAPHIARTCHELIADYYGLAHSVTFEEVKAFADTVEDATPYDDALRADVSDTASAREMTDLLCRLAANELIAPESTERLTQIMVKNQTGDARIRAGMPPAAWVAEKTGTLGKIVANDAGYIGWDGPEIAITCFTMSNTAHHPEALIAAAAAAVFARLASA